MCENRFNEHQYVLFEDDGDDYDSDDSDYD